MCPKIERAIRVLTIVLVLALLTSASWGQNQALQLDGDGDSMVVLSHGDLQPAQAFTIEFWAYLPDQGFGRVLNKGDGVRGITDRAYDFSYRAHVTEVEAFVAFTGGPASLISVPVQPGAWNHVALTFDSSLGVLAMLSNGHTEATHTTADTGQSLQGMTLRQTGRPLVVGRTPDFPVWDFEGQIDQLRIWNVALADHEVQCLMHDVIDSEGAASHPGLRAAWNFEASTVDAVQGYTGALQGDAAFATAEDIPVLFPACPRYFCAGDEAAGSCPCGNFGSPGHGCDTPQATGGVVLSLGTHDWNGNGGGSAVLVGHAFPASSSPTVVAIRSQAQQNGGLGTVFGDGLLCVGLPVTRVKSGAADLGSISLSITHGAGPGTFHYQLWYRSTPASFCDQAAAFNLSNGMTLAW